MRHRSGDRRGLLLRLRGAAPVRARGPRSHRSEDARAGRRRTCPTSARCGPVRRRIAFFTRRGEPLKVQLIRRRPRARPRCPATPSRTATRSSTSASAHTCRRPDGSGRSSWCPRRTRTGRATRRNQPMQRIYGTAFFKDDDLKQHLHRIEEAKKRDHRRARQGPRAVHVPPVGAGRRVLARQGHARSTTSWPTTCGGAVPRRLHGSQDAARSSTRRSGKRPGTGSTTARTCSSCRPKTPRWASRR